MSIHCLTYVKEDGRIHAHFIQTGAGTGRFACTDPNLQNLASQKRAWTKGSRSVRGRKREMYFCHAITLRSTLRAAAMLSKDKHLVEIFEKGIDVHTGTAARVFGVPEDKVTPEMRRKAKTINFGILYGMGVTSLKEGMKVDRAEAQEFYDQYRVTFQSADGIPGRSESICMEARVYGNHSWTQS
jgi:DNA polymerase-1